MNETRYFFAINACRMGVASNYALLINVVNAHDLTIAWIISHAYMNYH